MEVRIRPDEKEKPSAESSLVLHPQPLPVATWKVRAVPIAATEDGSRALRADFSTPPETRLLAISP